MEKPIPYHTFVLNRHDRSPRYMAVHGRLPDPTRRLDHAESLVLKVRWHLYWVSALSRKRR